jgi:hypothetical protein
MAAAGEVVDEEAVFNNTSPSSNPVPCTSHACTSFHCISLPRGRGCHGLYSPVGTADYAA